MSFLTPLFLLGALAVAAPIVYHLVRRTTRERTVFSSLMFLQPSPPRLSRRHRVEHWLLLLLRCLALVLLALGFSRPFFRQAAADDPTGAEPRRSVILVDTSASMRREGAWAGARARVEARLREAGPADQVAVYAFDRSVQAVVRFDDWNRTAPADRVAFALGRLGAITPSWGSTLLGNALISAAEALTETDPAAGSGIRQVVLVSDVQAGSRLEGLQAYEWPKGVELVLEPVKVDRPSNAGVQLVADAPDTARPANATVRVRVTNSADAKSEQFQLGWLAPAAGGPPNAAGFVGPLIDVYVPPGQARVFALPVPEGQNVERIGLRGDEDAFDNTVHVIPPVQRRTQVLWIGADAPRQQTPPLFFLRRALTDTPRLGVDIGLHPGADALPADALARSPVIFVNTALADGAASMLREQATAGKTLVLVLRGGDMAGTLRTLLGQPELNVSEVKPDTYAMLGEIDFQHPLFAPFADPRYSDFSKIHVWRHRKITGLNDTAKVVARFDHGDPAIVDVSVGRGRVLVLATGWHPDDSQLAVSTKFVPLLWSLLELAGAIPTAPSQYHVGDSVPVPSAPDPIRVHRSGGPEVTLPGTAAAFTGTDQPGVYEIRSGATVQRFAVNLDPNESRTAPLDAEELAQLGLPLTRPKEASPGAAREQATLQAAEAENRQKLWRWLIVGTLGILLIETLLAGRATRRARHLSSEPAT